MGYIRILVLMDRERLIKDCVKLARYSAAWISVQPFSSQHARRF